MKKLSSILFFTYLLCSSVDANAQECSNKIWNIPYKREYSLKIYQESDVNKNNAKIYSCSLFSNEDSGHQGLIFRESKYKCSDNIFINSTYSKRVGDQYGNISWMLKDKNGKTFTLEDQSVPSPSPQFIPGQIFRPTLSTRPKDYMEYDKTCHTKKQTTEKLFLFNETADIPSDTVIIFSTVEYSISEDKPKPSL